jgi:cytoskeletal protein CcmA (bactofilin family)
MKNKKPAGHSISTFLGSDARVEGTIEFDGTIRLDGRVKGSIKSGTGTVIVGEKAHIEADISVGAVMIMGNVTGKVEAKDKIEVIPPGQVVGDIKAPVVTIEAGGKLHGNCSMDIKPGSGKPNTVGGNIKPISAVNVNETTEIGLSTGETKGK